MNITSAGRLRCNSEGTEHYPFRIRERFDLWASLWHAREVKTSTIYYPSKYHLPGNSK